MDTTSQQVLTEEIALENPTTGKRLDGVIFTGTGRELITSVSATTGLPGMTILDAIVHRLLVQKGADWTSVILSEYMELFDDSSGIFSVVWDKTTKQFVSHGCTFQSIAHPFAALLAHIRTIDEFKGMGLGTRVTESVTAAAFARGAQLVVLATDDKIHRLADGGRAAHSMYSRMGYTILGEKRLADTVDWMMAIDHCIFDECQKSKSGAERFPQQPDDNIQDSQEQLVERIRNDFGPHADSEQMEIGPVSPGDLANLFVLLNLCPEVDFQLKLSSWDVHHGPEAERNFITTLRQAIVDQDRLQDATQVVRNSNGSIVAVCAAQQQSPFTRQSYRIDFYCLPQFLKSKRSEIIGLVQQTIVRIESSHECPHPCELVFSGIDAEKCSLFESLNFVRNEHRTNYYGPDGNQAFAAVDFIRELK